MVHMSYVGCATRSRAAAMTRFTFCVKKKKKGSSQQMVSERLALGLVRKSGKWKPRVVSEFKCNKRAIGNLKSFNQNMELNCNTPYALLRFCNAHCLIYVCR
jgi:hypothetical protein